MRLFFEKDCNFADISPLTLAFIGDSVYDLIAREYVVIEANRPANELNKRAVSLVNANAQADGVKKILGTLSEEELTVYKRGRNAHPNHSSKSSDIATYHSATGLEALFGYLYLKGENKRILELFKIIASK